MEIKIINDRNNALLKRREINFKILHEGEATPTRGQVKTALMENIGEPREKIVIDYMKTEFGLSSTKAYAKIYKSEKDCLHYESKAVLLRNKLIAEEKDKEK